MNFESTAQALHFKALRAFNHALRQDILTFLREREQASVQDIEFKLKIHQCVISQHLKILRDASLVSFQTKGWYKMYSVNEHNIEWLDTLAKDWEETVTEKKKRVEVEDAVYA